MCHKVIYFLTAAAIAALLIGGFVILLRDDVQEIRQYRKIKPYRPDMSVLDTHETGQNNAESVPEMPAESKEKIVAQVQRFGENFDNSVGWIYVPDTKINYPVMYSGDNEFYLHRAVDGSYLRVGSVFLDYRCSPDFMGQINILYGHNMSDGSMFADVMNYIDEEYFYSHNIGWLTTSDCVYRIEFFSVTQPESSDIIYDISIPLESWTKMLRNRSYIWKDVSLSEGDKLISFSTCTDSEGTSRTLLTGKLASVPLDPNAHFIDS